jgi:CheY-like chemotaxis protein
LYIFVGDIPNLKAMKSICIVDDDDIYKIVFRKSLEILGFRSLILDFKDGREAIEYLANAKQDQIPDTFFLDINMSEMDGWEFMTEFNQIKSRFNKEIEIYLVSTSSLQRDIERAKRIPSVIGYLVKPVPYSKLRAILERTYSLSH